jgi:hypothetical protein
MADINPSLIPERTGVNSIGSSDNPWEVVNVDKLHAGGRDVPVVDIATTDQVPANSVNLIPTPFPILDDGKIVVAKDGQLILQHYPVGALPVSNAELAGKVLMIGRDGVPQFRECATLPEVVDQDEGAVIRVVGGILKVVKGNPHGDVAPTPIAPTTDGMTLVSENQEWVLKNAHSQFTLPPIGPEHAGMLVCLERDDYEDSVKVVYRHPPLAGTEPGAMPPLSGSANHYLDGTASWKMVTAGNGGHYRLGDIKPTVRPVEDPWLPCQGAYLGTPASGADYTDIQFKPLYAMCDGTASWEANWNNNIRQQLPIIPWCQICFLPDAQAPASFVILGDAAAGGNSFFEIELCRQYDFISDVTRSNSSTGDLGWYRLGGVRPVPLSSGGDAFSSAESIMFDTSELSGVGPGAWYYRLRQLVGSLYPVSVPQRWQYGSSIVIGDLN